MNAVAGPSRQVSGPHLPMPLPQGEQGYENPRRPAGIQTTPPPTAQQLAQRARQECQRAR